MENLKIVHSLYDKYNKALYLQSTMDTKYNFYPYMGIRLTKKTQTSQDNPFSYYVDKKCELYHFITEFEMMLAALNQEDRMVFRNTYVKKIKYWWLDEGYSTSTYYRRKKRLDEHMYELLMLLHPFDYEEFADITEFDNKPRE